MAEEEELRRRKEEMVSVFLKMKLSREEQKSGLNSSKLIDHWRGTRREIKTKELQSEMSVQKDAFERALLKKNRHIELLLQVCTVFKNKLLTKVDAPKNRLAHENRCIKRPSQLRRFRSIS